MIGRKGLKFDSVHGAPSAISARLLLLGLTVSLVLLPQPAAADWVVGAGSTVRLGDGRLDLGCNDLVIASGGTLLGEQGSVNLGGSWFGDGSFLPGTSTVTLGDGCVAPVSEFVGDNQFYNLIVWTATGREIRFESGATQDVEAHLELVGADGNLLHITSSVPQSHAFFNLREGGTQLIDWVYALDNHATGQWLAPGPPEQYNSVYSGTLLRWFLGPQVIPTLSSVGIVILTLVMLLLGVTLIRRASYTV